MQRALELGRIGIRIGISLALASAACTGDGGGQDTDTATGTDDGTATVAPECTTPADCGTCMACQAGMCVPDEQCADTGPECTVPEDCGPCGDCADGVCLDSTCDDVTGDPTCRDGQWCEQDVAWCIEGQCVDVPTPAALPACTELGEIKPVVVQPQIQNAAVHWLDIDASGGTPDIVAVAAGSLNAWRAPDWTLAKTALSHEGSAMDVLRGHAGARAIEAGGPAQTVALHAVQAGGSFTLLTTLDFGADVLDLLAVDVDGDGVDEAAVRTATGILQLTIDGDSVAAGSDLFAEPTTDARALRGGLRNQIVAGLAGGRSVVIAVDDAGQVVLDTSGLVNPWGAERVVTFGGKYGLLGQGAPSGSALALSGGEPLATVAGPAGASSIAALEAGATFVAIGGTDALLIVPVGDDGPQCAVSVKGGPVDAIALGDLGEGTLGIAVVVAGELHLSTLSDALN